MGQFYGKILKWGCSSDSLRYHKKNHSATGFVRQVSRNRGDYIDERQITHLICARLKNMIYMTFSGGVFGPFIQEKERKQAQNTP